eukprot:PITA_05106
MVDEMTSLHKNEAWDLVELSAGRKPIGRKWVYKKKTNAEGKVEKYKSRLVEKGYSKVLGIDFGDIFSLVAKVTCIILLLSVATAFDFEVEQMDVKKTFLHRDLEEEIYMKKPEGFAVKGKKELTRHCTCSGIIEQVYVKIGKEHWTTVKRVFKYLGGTSDYGLCYKGKLGLDRVLDICGFVDVDWAGVLDQRRSTSGYVFNLFGGAISWMSKKKSVGALSTIEAEYMAATHAKKEVVWLQRLCSSMGLVQGAIRIDCDSQSAVFLAKDPAYHSKKKHIDVQYHFVRDMIEDKKMFLVKVDTLKNTADALTKSVRSKMFSWCREIMGIAGLDK